ncbi:hypothetical protein EV10_0222 [Prochlorococcus marinus str. SS51]|nr:hypothetical protein EV08_0669 [Prochlorococcus marinus str. SS2]KGG23078.1 hypothetical protein EV09_1823 [Prochlorococcus marinus str. SS35]KGG33785.1 hypothetical protein EV10_0222 [Prochlorococcus marinus str. SS51]
MNNECILIRFIRISSFFGLFGIEKPAREYFLSGMGDFRNNLR